MAELIRSLIKKRGELIMAEKNKGKVKETIKKKIKKKDKKEK